MSKQGGPSWFALIFRSHMKKLLFLILAIGGGLCAQTLDPLPNDFKKEMKTGLVAVPTSLGTLATVDVLVDQLYLRNTSAGSLTVNVCDRSGTPKCVIDTGQTITAGQILMFTWPKGEMFRSGLTWVASGSGIVGSISARKQ